MALFQLNRLQCLLRHAVQNVPFYHALYDRHRISPEDIRTLDDISRLPLIDKTDLRGLPPEKIIASGVNPNRLIIHYTSGTTGVPTAARRTWLEERLCNYFRWRSKIYHGLKPRDKTVVLSLGLSPAILPQRLMSFAGLFRTHKIDVLAPAEETLQQLVRLRPDVLAGYPGVLAEVASIINAQQRHLVKPRVVLTGGEPLPPLLRRTISKGFQSRVVDIYGSSEFNCIAWQCTHTEHLHTCDDNVIVEILKDGRHAQEGETGEVVCTALHSYAAPLIRFRTGDMAVKGAAQCPCKRPYATIKRIEGRKIEYFILPSGRKIHAYKLFEPILRHSYPWIRQYQLLQTRSDLVELKLVPLEAGISFSLDALEKDGQRILGPEVRFKVILTTEIPSLPSGKIATYQCLVSEPERVEALQLPG